MSTAIADISTPVAMPEETYLNADHSLKSWLLTVDHKRICILYLLTITFFFFIGGFMATLVRLELLTPQGDLLSSAATLSATEQHRAGNLHGLRYGDQWLVV